MTSIDTKSRNTNFAHSVDMAETALLAQGDAQPTYLTPDALMAYCASRLQNIDDKMQTEFDRQQKFRDASEGLATLEDQFNRMSQETFNTATPGFAETKASIDKTFDDLDKTMPEGKTKEEFEAAYATWKNTMTDDCVATPEATQLANALKNVNSGITSSAELDMIHLQSLMSQRQTAIQICTNLVASLGDTAMKVAEKVGT
jgi:hypothetical protein